MFNELLIKVWYLWPDLVLYEFLMLKMLKYIHSKIVPLSAALHSCTELTHHISTVRILKITVDAEWLKKNILFVPIIKLRLWKEALVSTVLLVF